MEENATHFLDADRAVGYWTQLADPLSVELAAEMGFDFVTVDLEHSPASFETVQTLLQAIAAGRPETDPLVRVPSHDPVPVKRVLDLGADTLLFPMVETPDQARGIVDAMRYPPEGNRGVGPHRAGRLGLDTASYVATADDRVRAVVQIESRTGVENADAVAAVEGVDALYVGPGDLSAAYGAFGDTDDDAVADAITRIVEAAHDRGIPVGAYAPTIDDVAALIDDGVDFVNAGTDLTFLRERADAYKRRFERASGDVRDSA